MDCSMPGLPVFHYLPEFAQTHVHWVGDAIQPSHHKPRQYTEKQRHYSANKGLYSQSYSFSSSHIVAQMVKSLPAVRETQVRSLDQEDPLEKEMATHSSILVWKIPWMEEPGQLQSEGSQRVGHNWTTSLSFFFFLYGCESWTIKKAERQRIDTFKLWCWRRLLRVPWTARRSTSQSERKSTLNIHWKDWCWRWSSNTLATWCEELIHWKRPWCWERSRDLRKRGWQRMRYLFRIANYEFIINIITIKLQILIWYHNWKETQSCNKYPDNF